MANTVAATYIGGYNGGNGTEASGVLVRSDEGLTFTWSRMGPALNTQKGRFTIPHDEIIAISLDDVDALRTLRSAATWTWWGGVAGGLLTSDASSLRIVAFRCRQNDVESTVLFACPDLGARNFVEGLQRDRQDAGLAPLPSLKSLNPNPIETQQLALLQDISAKLDRLIEALEKPA